MLLMILQTLRLQLQKFLCEFSSHATESCVAEVAKDFVLGCSLMLKFGTNAGCRGTLGSED
jgi:hypothetical protein